MFLFRFFFHKGEDTCSAAGFCTSMPLSSSHRITAHLLQAERWMCHPGVAGQPVQPDWVAGTA